MCHMVWSQGERSGECADHLISPRKEIKYAGKNPCKISIVFLHNERLVHLIKNIPLNFLRNSGALPLKSFAAFANNELK